MKRVFSIILLISLAAISCGQASISVPPPVTKPAASQPEPEDAFAKAVKKYSALATRDTPRAALMQLRIDAQSDPELAKLCHPLVHQLGHDAYARYNDFQTALKYQENTCNSGYLHGVIEAYFVNSTNVYEDMKTVCTAQDFGRCHHAIGHGLMYFTSNDLPKSISLCKSQFSRTDAQNYCSQGVYMENFNTNQELHPSKYLHPDDQFYPCAEQEARFQASCFYYAPAYYLTTHAYDYPGAFSWCSKAGKTYEPQCVRGVASLAIKYNITNPQMVEGYCNNLSPTMTGYCIDGMVGLYVNHYDSLKQGHELCASLEPKNQQTCETSVQSRSSLFNE